MCRRAATAALLWALVIPCASATVRTRLECSLDWTEATVLKTYSYPRLAEEQHWTYDTDVLDIWSRHEEWGSIDDREYTDTTVDSYLQFNVSSAPPLDQWTHASLSVWLLFEPPYYPDQGELLKIPIENSCSSGKQRTRPWVRQGYTVGNMTDEGPWGLSEDGTTLTFCLFISIPELQRSWDSYDYRVSSREGPWDMRPYLTYWTDGAGASSLSLSPRPSAPCPPAVALLCAVSIAGGLVRRLRRPPM